jgi:predicted Zn-dependent peptidase
MTLPKNKLVLGTVQLGMKYGLILGKSDSVEKIYEGLESVTKEDILRVAKKFCVPERLNLAIIGPYDNVERFKNIVIPKTK